MVVHTQAVAVVELQQRAELEVQVIQETVEQEQQLQLMELQQLLLVVAVVQPVEVL